MTSHDHPMSGGFGVWFFKYLGGIQQDPDREGCLKVAPIVPSELGSVNCLRSVRNGRVISNWYKEGSSIHYDIEIPWNTDAEIVITLRNANHSVKVNGVRVSRLSSGVIWDGNKLKITCSGGYFHIVDIGK